MVGYGAALGGVLGVFEYTGGSFSALYKELTMDEVSRKETIRATRQRPIDELIALRGEDTSK